MKLLIVIPCNMAVRIVAWHAWDSHYAVAKESYFGEEFFLLFVSYSRIGTAMSCCVVGDRIPRLDCFDYASRRP